MSRFDNQSTPPTSLAPGALDRQEFMGLLSEHSDWSLDSSLFASKFSELLLVWRVLFGRTYIWLVGDDGVSSLFFGTVFRLGLLDGGDVSWGCCWVGLVVCPTFKGRALEQLGLKYRSNGFVVRLGARPE